MQDLMRTQTMQLRDDVRRVLRETSVSPAGRHPGSARAACSCAFPDPADRDTVLPKLRELSQPIGNAILGQTGARDLDVTEQPDGLIQLTFTEAGVNERVRRAVDQAIEVLRRRIDALGTTEPSIQRQGADRILVAGAGPAGPAAAEGASSADREARIPHARRAGQPADVDMLPSKDDGRPARAGRAPRHRRGRRPHRRAARPSTSAPASRSSTSASTSAARSASARRRPENVGRPLAIVLDNEVISAPRIQSADHRRRGPDLRPLHGAAGQRPRGAAARRRAAGQAHHRRGAHRRPGPRPGFDRGRQDGDLRRDRASSSSSCSRPTASSASSPTSRLLVHVGLIFGADVGARGDADAARHRRHRAHHRHGGRFERADLRAHPRGGAGRAARSSRRSRRASTAPSRPSSIPTRPWRSPP